MVEVKLGEDHTGDVGREEDQGQTKDTDKVLCFQCGLVRSDVLGLLGSLDEPADEVDQPGHDWTADRGQDDSEGDGGEAQEGIDVVTDRAGKVHLLADHWEGVQKKKEKN